MGWGEDQEQDFMNMDCGFEPEVRPVITETPEESPYRDMSDGMGLKYYITCILMVILFYAVMFRPSAEDEYLTHGIKTVAVVTEIQQGAMRHRETCYGTYVDAWGATRRAQIITNDFNTYEGKEIEGYYLPDKPNTVWCRPAGSVNFVLKGLACVFGVAGIIGLLAPFILAIRKR